MRILVEPSAHHLLNAGDAAMLQVACERLAQQWPEASVGVLTDSPERLAEICPGVTPVPAAGRRLWFEEPYVSAQLHHRLPAAVAARVGGAERELRHRAPAVAATTIRARRRLKRTGSGDLDAFLDWTSAADLVVVSGAGLLVDPFAPRAVTVLEVLRAARRRGAATAMLGQGVGRFTDPALVAEARRTLPGVGVIGLREEETGRPVLRSLGVADERMVTTGDDAVELAHRLRSRERGDGIGLALRRARYADLGETEGALVAQVVARAAARRGVPVVPVPISAVGNERDESVIAAALDGDMPSVDLAPGLPSAVIEQVGRCRVVVAGSYHAAVFALSQGIPAIGLAASEYYVEKFRGLGAQFGGHCPMVRLDEPDVSSRLEATLNALWDSADDLREPLLDAAKKQIEAGRRAYARIVATPAAAPSRSGPVARARHALAVAVQPRLRFNCANQQDPAWDERARSAVRLVAADLDGAAAGPPLRVADLGCGNQRLRGALALDLQRPVAYRGYDLHPQAPDVVRLDVGRELPPGPFDVVFCLGLLEYIGDLDALAHGLREIAERVVVSYVVADGSERLTPAEREARGWCNHLTRAELEQRFLRAGLALRGVDVTNRGRTLVWLFAR